MNNEYRNANNTNFKKGIEMIIDNNIAKDTYSERAERLQLFSTNIDAFAVEIGIFGDR